MRIRVRKVLTCAAAGHTLVKPCHRALSSGPDPPTVKTLHSSCVVSRRCPPDRLKIQEFDLLSYNTVRVLVAPPSSERRSWVDLRKQCVAQNHKCNQEGIRAEVSALLQQ